VPDCLASDRVSLLAISDSDRDPHKQSRKRLGFGQVARQAHQKQRNTHQQSTSCHRQLTQYPMGTHSLLLVRTQIRFWPTHELGYDISFRIQNQRNQSRDVTFTLTPQTILTLTMIPCHPCPDVIYLSIQVSHTESDYLTFIFILAAQNILGSVTTSQRSPITAAFLQRRL
jgi:hypothetical protein